MYRRITSAMAVVCRLVVFERRAPEGDRTPAELMALVVNTLHREGEEALEDDLLASWLLRAILEFAPASGEHDELEESADPDLLKGAQLLAVVLAEVLEEEAGAEDVRRAIQENEELSALLNQSM